MVIKKELITPQRLGSCDLQQIANAGLNKVKSDITHLLNSLEVLPSASDKTQFLVKTFLRTLILVKNAINNLDLLKESGPDWILVVVLKNC